MCRCTSTATHTLIAFADEPLATLLGLVAFLPLLNALAPLDANLSSELARVDALELALPATALDSAPTGLEFSSTLLDANLVGKLRGPFALEPFATNMFFGAFSVLFNALFRWRFRWSDSYWRCSYGCCCCRCCSRRSTSDGCCRSRSTSNGCCCCRCSRCRCVCHGSLGCRMGCHWRSGHGGRSHWRIRIVSIHGGRHSGRYKLAPTGLPFLLENANERLAAVSFLETTRFTFASALLHWLSNTFTPFVAINGFTLQS